MKQDETQCFLTLALHHNFDSIACRVSSMANSHTHRQISSAENEKDRVVTLMLPSKNLAKYRARNDYEYLQ
jgi:hypothetical protein